MVSSTDEFHQCKQQLYLSAPEVRTGAATSLSSHQRLERGKIPNPDKVLEGVDKLQKVQGFCLGNQKGPNDKESR